MEGLTAMAVESREQACVLLTTLPSRPQALDLGKLCIPLDFEFMRRTSLQTADSTLSGLQPMTRLLITLLQLCQR